MTPRQGRSSRYGRAKRCHAFPSDSGHSCVSCETHNGRTPSMSTRASLAPEPEDWPYSLEHRPVTALYVDKHYQRPPTAIVKRIIAAYDPRLLYPIIASEREDRANAAIVDGQSRWLAFKALSFETIPALVFRGTL